LPTPHVIDTPPEFLEANIGYIASWSEAEGRSNSCPRQKEDLKAKKSSSSFCAVVVPWQRRDLPLIDVPDLSGVLSLFSVSLSLLLSNIVQPFAFMTMGESLYKVDPFLPPEVTKGSKNYQSSSSDQITNKEQSSVGVQVGSGLNNPNGFYVKL